MMFSVKAVTEASGGFTVPNTTVLKPTGRSRPIGALAKRVVFFRLAMTSVTFADEMDEFWMS